jgi:serine/threonine-protein phosphatase CPPED1
MLADPQFGMYALDKDFVRETANYEFTVAAVNRLKPAFVIVLGDMVNKTGDAAQIGEFLRITKKIDASIPVRYVAGNHDIGHEPAPNALAEYRKSFGPDYYSFRSGPVYGIVLDSNLIIAPQKDEADAQAQMAWLKKELETAKGAGVSQIVIFQHHPYFLKEPNEPDQYGTIPLERRRPMLELLRQYGVRYVFAGHTHKNNIVKDGDMEIVASGPVAQPFGDDGSGIRLAIASESAIQHKYYDFGRLPDRLEIK